MSTETPGELASAIAADHAAIRARFPVKWTPDEKQDLWFAQVSPLVALQVSPGNHRRLPYQWSVLYRDDVRFGVYDVAHAGDARLIGVATRRAEEALFADVDLCTLMIVGDKR